MRMMSMLKSRNYIPHIFRESRDIQVFLRIFDILYNITNYDISHLVDLISMDRCPDKFLPLLANYQGYEYDNTLSPGQNREIIKNYRDLTTHRGSETGIKNAIILSVVIKEDVTMKELIGLARTHIEYDYDKGLIKIYYPPLEYKTLDLLEVVRPIGMRIEFTTADTTLIYDKIDVYDRRKIAQYNYNLQYVGSYSEVGHAEANPSRKDETPTE